MRRLIPSEPTALAPEGLVKSSNADTVLNTCNMAGQLGLLQQLGWLASYSHEVFGDLTREAEASYGRVVALKHRLHRVTERLARVDDAVANANEEELAQICATNQPQEFKVAGDETSNLFTPHTRPAALQATLEEAQPPPKLEWMDQFVERDASANPYHKYGLHESCMTHFSDQDFFVKQFLDEEEKKVKKLKEERRARREQRRQREGGGTAKPMYAKGAKRVKKKRFMTEEEQLARGLRLARSEYAASVSRSEYAASAARMIPANVAAWVHAHFQKPELSWTSAPKLYPRCARITKHAEQIVNEGGGESDAKATRDHDASERASDRA